MEGNKIQRRVSALLCLIAVLFLSVFMVTPPVYANSYDTLKQYCKSGEYPPDNPNGNSTLMAKQYKRSGGDYYLYTDITLPTDFSHIISETAYSQLTAGAKQEFLKDFITIAYDWEAYHNQTMTTTSGGEIITGETVSDLMYELQNVSGAGSQIMAALLSDVKADYATADRIFKPFSGPISTIIGLLCIIMMSLLALTMALDLAYITIPMFRLMLDGEDGGGGGGQGGNGGSALSKIVSAEAKTAVQTAEGGGGGGGQSGSGNKIAVGQYFKMRWKGLLVLGICLLYLVGGHIFSFVAWVIDLVSGFLGF